MRKQVIAGNWKMNKLSKDSVEFVIKLKDLIIASNKEIVICAPFLNLQKLVEIAKGTAIKIGAQNMHFASYGAYTGEISAEMLKDIGVEYVIIGHSERRQFFNETDETVNLKIKKAIEVGLKPIFCVGETEEEYNKKKTKEIVSNQILKGFLGISADDIEKVIIAYEPIWAIGTGKVATSEDANNVISFIRKTLKKELGVGDNIIIQYGGSVKPSNIQEFLSTSDIDGALVGGASLVLEDFLELIR